MHQKILIYSDLDGSLLDHFSYSFAPAQSLLGQLEQLKIPVIPVTSKTRAELLPLRQALGNRHPFIIENGAAVFIPHHYFPSPPAQCEQYKGYYCHRFSQPRSVWQALLQQQTTEFGGEFVSFTDMGCEGIVEVTGLSEESARLANQRDYSEPVLWQGSQERKQQFIACLQLAGATVLQGGRFLHVTGECDKGLALTWLTEVYRHYHPDSEFLTLAAGDSGNDIAMLEAADKALLIKSPVHESPVVNNNCCYHSRNYGPEGWVEGVEHLTGITVPTTSISNITRND
ncbi:mannosyl-3-phosphoglycerate phosphatase [Neptuniibacter sp.]|uniref:HAD-IIB family hydrolase n=1 Tax=Neptuniibacter sp. TaxID=1962643 RepID=UPI00261FFFEA|nr:HAD-IIB family hydrolase [Neptuniibacter sp.]MCP4598020.1 HAD-IIB family hydrolase [Neptuniibacter sp.]